MIDAKVQEQGQSFHLLIAGAETLPSHVRSAAAIGMERGLLYTVGLVQREYLSGPRPTRLDIVTRRLRDSIATQVQNTGTGVIGRIGTNVVYAAYHEFGFHGVVNVKAHSRLGHAVKAHERHVDYAGKPFLRPGLRKAMPVVTQQIIDELKSLQEQ